MSVTPEELGRQLRTPSGPLGLKVAEGMNQTNQQLIAYCQEALALAPGDSLLEVGPGNGQHVPALLAGLAGSRYLGLDLSPDMVAAAQVHSSPQIRFEQGDLLSHPPPGPFDKALAINVAYFWQPLAPALKALFEALKVGGTLVLGVRDRATMASQPQFQEGFTFFDGHDLAQALEEAGFTVSYRQRPEHSVTILGQLMPKQALIYTAIKEAAC